jgi:hypothetical protein
VALLSVMALSCGFLGASTGVANADLVQYSVFLGASTWQADTCAGGVPNCSRMSGAAANYQGAGTVNVCERVEDITVGGVASQRCANGYADALSDLSGRSTHCLALRVMNNSGSAHTIVGLISRIANC